jgi:N-acetylglutamate synthase-like GNAT family acetyltransferase
MSSNPTLADPVRATSEDARALQDLANKSYETFIPVMGAIPAPMLADYDEMVRANEVWIHRTETTLTASLVLIRQEDHLLIESIAVDPDHQGKGHGQLLLNWARRRAKEIGFSELRLYTNVLMTRNRAWYQRAGFTEMHEEQRGDKHIVHMHLFI